LLKYWNLKNADTLDNGSVCIYRLVDFTYSDTSKASAMTSLNEEMDSLKERNEDLIPMSDFLEIIATLTQLKKTNNFSPQLYLFYIAKKLNKEKMLIYSAFISNLYNEVVCMHFPTDNFMSGFINNKYATYLSGKDISIMNFAFTDIVGLPDNVEYSYYITTARQVKP